MLVFSALNPVAFFASLEILQMIEYEDELAESRQHHGRSALIGTVARKAARNDARLRPVKV